MWMIDFTRKDCVAAALSGNGIRSCGVASSCGNDSPFLLVLLILVFVVVKIVGIGATGMTTAPRRRSRTAHDSPTVQGSFCYKAVFLRTCTSTLNSLHILPLFLSLFLSLSLKRHNHISSRTTTRTTISGYRSSQEQPMQSRRTGPSKQEQVLRHPLSPFNRQRRQFRTSHQNLPQTLPTLLTRC